MSATLKIAVINILKGRLNEFIIGMTYYIDFRKESSNNIVGTLYSLDHIPELLYHSK